MNRKYVFVIAVVIAVILPMSLVGQEKKGGGEKKMDAAPVSITGCFNKGADADHYVIKDDKTGKETAVTGDNAMLARHANNHQVTLTGAMSKEKDKDVLKATELKMLALCK